MASGEVAVRVEIAAESDEIRDAWHHVFDLVEQLPASDWCLIGGMMVQIHVNRYGEPSLTRATEDVDILGNSRARTNVIERIGQLLKRLSYAPQTSGSRDGLSVIYRFVNPRGQIVDLLAPDGLKKTPYAIRGSETIQVKGGTQALQRTEIVEVIVDDRSALIPCPSLEAAILMKARSIGGKDRSADRDDLIALLACVPDPLTTAAEYSTGEIKRIRECESHLRLDDNDLAALVSPDRLAAARLAFRLITA